MRGNPTSLTSLLKKNAIPHRGIGMLEHKNIKRMNDSLNMKAIQHSVKRTKNNNLQQHYL